MAEVSGGVLKLAIVTPERAVLDAAVEAVTLPAFDGEFGVLRGHEPFVARLGPGELRYTQNGAVTRLFVDGGFAQCRADVVTVLTAVARPAESLSADQAAKDLAAAEALPGEGVAAEAKRRALERARAAVRVAAK